ncbi:uncharacterized protein BO80DRAFT_411417 [Aspergillus ibericus CBS 121593]|uniref:Uncharacterized protein n=1 Tax=Aspergillus ibericus CBS 121593 TaxID=1448316 RepID=A0A395GVY0_9EURO|nr:hypothetical protein BO80DRAFT_411417 [Aspergillus ibericus CBS 121593]RAK98847.1 hypothetical protein BO80DRAFT_411417 [Aspergillus ibericus CBS 121593]
MFRRKRSSSQHQHPLSASSSQSAQSAASHAFLKSQPSSSSLSSAAAAAALRSLTPTPTSVENVQTKRMMQRRASVSSQASGVPSLRPTSRNGLRRANSSASMSTRTFRDQSPRRPASSSGPVDVAPPLPSIPREYTARNTKGQRSTSVGPAQRPSPRAKPAAGRGMSVDRGSATRPAPRATPSPDLRRPGSRNSVNFSYPMNSRPNSPDGPANALDRRDASASIPGRGAQSVGTAVAAAQAAIVPRMQDITQIHTPPAAPRIPVPREQTIPDQVHSQPAAPPEQKQPARPHLVKRPSTVPEDAQGEKRAESDAPGQRTVPPRVGSVTPDAPVAIKFPPTPDTGKDQLLSPPVSPPEPTPSTDVGRDNKPSNVPQSGSPGRSAHFSRHLLVAAFAGEHLHQPPPRSLSPAKSAMKNSRKSSLSPEGRTESVLRPGPPLSELSDGTSVASDEGTKQGIRRKPIKVSFDDEAEVVGIAASPPTSPDEVIPESLPELPKSKSSWFSGKRKPTPLNTEFDEVLKPRRALPSFGSIRAGRDGDVQEKAVPELSDNESTTSSDSPAEALRWSFSNDHAIGGLLSDNQSKESEQRVAPLMLANAAESESEAEKSPQQSHFTGRSDLAEAPGGPAAALEVSSHAEQGRTAETTLAVPNIMVQPASPDPSKARSSLEWYEVPGGFPRSSLEFDRKAHGKMKAKEKSTRHAAGDAALGPVDDEASGDESGDSIYSDAEEGVEGNGYGSINAIVDDETAADPGAHTAAVPAPPAETGGIEEKPPPSSTDWPSIPDTCQIARAGSALPDKGMAPIPESPGSSHEPLSFSSPYPPFPTQSQSRRSSSQGDLSRSSSVTVRPARHSMLVGASNSPSLGDQDLRGVDGVNGSLSPQPEANNLRQRPPQDSIRKRPVSWSPAAMKGPSSDVNRVSYVNGKNAPASPRPLSSGSDSSSSFKRASRPARADSSYTMRRTMRGNTPSRLAPNRATSPPVETRPVSSEAGPSTMRTTLRGNSSKREKPSFFSNSKAPKSKLTKAPGGVFASRFPDSDSDDEGYEAWRSRHRYEDSSDDDTRGPNTMRPVRGIPRRQGARDGDSTELEDSSDDEHRAPPRAMPQSPGKSNPSRDPALAAVAKNRGMTEDELDEFLRQPDRGRKPGLLHRFSLRKSRSPVNRVQAKASLDGSVRNGALPERARLDQEPARGDPALPGPQSNIVTTITATNPPPPPSKLLRRPSQRSSRGDSWPLRSDRKESRADSPAPASGPSERLATVEEASLNGSTVVPPAPEPAAKENENPSTGVSGVKFEGRPANVADVAISSSGRKKRFPRLRKAFGLRS